MSEGLLFSRKSSAVLVALACLLASSARAQEEELPPDAEQPLPLREGDWFSTRFGELRKELADRITTPRAAATLYRMDHLADHLDSLAPLAQTFVQVASEPRATPEVRSLARELAAQVEVSRGRVPRARGHRLLLGDVRNAWIVGGFDNEGGTGHETAFPPETGPIDLKASYQGKERDVVWRRLPALGLDARVPVADFLRPLRNITFYVLTTIDATEPQKVVVHFGTSGATKLWVGGAPVFSDDADHPSRFDQRGLVISLKKGVNPLLLKVSTLEESASFYLRVVKPGEKLLDKARVVAPETTILAVGNGAGIVATPADDPGDQLAKLLEKAPTDARLREDYAQILAERRPFATRLEKHLHEQEAAATALATDARAFFRVAAWTENDANEKRQWLDRALNADPNYAAARTRLGKYYLDGGYSRRAYDELQRAVADGPTYAPAKLALADALVQLGMQARAQRVTLDTFGQFPTTPEAILEAARTERQLGRVKASMERLRVLISMRYDHRAARSELSSEILDTGDVKEAAAVLERGLELWPTSLSMGLRLGKIFSNNDDAAAATRTYDRLAALAPDADEVFEARGRHRLRAGDEAGALVDFEAALRLKPQNPQLRELVLTLRPRENFAAPYLRDVVQLAKAARAAPPPKDEAAIVLADVTVVRVYPNGLSSHTKQEIVQVLDQRGVDANRVKGVRYTPGEQELTIERARVVKPDGTIVDSKSESDRSLTDSSSGMWFDNRQRVIAFPNLAPGDVVELTSRLDDTSTQNMFADYFGDVEYLQGTDPVRESDYVLLAPSNRAFYANEPQVPGLLHTVQELGDRRKEWRWRASDIPKIDPEQRMPGWADVAAYLHVSTFREWNDVAKFWWGLVREQLHATPEVQKAAEEAVKGIPATDVRGRVRAVYDAVVTKTRYVGLEFGIHGFKPYKVDRVLARRFGDCKDKASLMKSMLGAIGIESRLVLLRMRHLGHLAPQPASLAVFNHAILYVPDFDWYLDGTAEFSGSSEIPGADQGAQVLVVEDDGKVASKFLTTPVSKPADNVTSTLHEVTLAGDLSGRIRATSTIKGQSAAGWRRAYESESGRREKFESSYARSYPGARAVSFDIGDVRGIEKPVETRFILDVPKLARADGASVALEVFGESFRYAETLAPQSTRRFPVELGPPWRNEFTYDVLLPDSLAPGAAVPPAEGTSKFGSYRMEVTGAGERVKVTGFVAISAAVIEPADYPAFREFLGELDRTFTRPVPLRRLQAAQVRP